MINFDDDDSIEKEKDTINKIKTNISNIMATVKKSVRKEEDEPTVISSSDDNESGNANKASGSGILPKRKRYIKKDKKINVVGERINKSKKNKHEEDSESSVEEMEDEMRLIEQSINNNQQFRNVRKNSYI